MIIDVEHLRATTNVLAGGRGETWIGRVPRTTVLVWQRTRLLDRVADTVNLFNAKSEDCSRVNITVFVEVLLAKVA